VVVRDPIPLSEVAELVEEVEGLLGPGAVFDCALAQELGVRFALRAAEPEPEPSG
jgi:hypothetical protein